MKVVKELYERRRQQQIGDEDIFYIFPLFLGSTTIQWVRKFFLNINEMVESTSQGVKNALVVSWVYMCPYLVFKALTTCSVYKSFLRCVSL